MNGFVQPSYATQPLFTAAWQMLTVPRTFVRCVRDKIQPRPLQDVLIENCSATEVVDIESGHTPAVAAPAELATILDRIAAR